MSFQGYYSNTKCKSDWFYIGITTVIFDISGVSNQKLLVLVRAQGASFVGDYGGILPEKILKTIEPRKCHFLPEH